MTVREVASDGGRFGVYLVQGMVRTCFNPRQASGGARKIRRAAKREMQRARRKACVQRREEGMTYSGTRSKAVS